MRAVIRFVSIGAVGAAVLGGVPAVATAQGQASAPGQAPAQSPGQPPAQTRAPTPTPGQPRGAPTSANYTINIGDQIQVYVWGEERLQRELRVLPDGTIAFPLVGQLRVQGLLPADVERLVSERLKTQYRGEVPNVTVSVINPAGLQFSVMGKVRQPGAFNPGRYINVLDAITLAGGPAEFANMDNISILRSQGGNLTTLRVKLGSILRGGASASDIDRANVIPLVPGDIVVVP